MSIKSLLFILFLCICLVWVAAVYLHTGPEIQRFGLFWTAVVLIAALAMILGARIFYWWRLWRAKAGARPAAPAKPALVVHEDDAALAALIAEANAALVQAPGYVRPRGKTPLSGLPLYLLVGPSGSGKTSTFLNSGIEPQPLAGQGDSKASTPTRLCNLWLAKNALFVEISGRAFEGEIARWCALLNLLRGKATLPVWRRLWREPDDGLALRGVIGFGDVKELSGAAGDPQRLENLSRRWQERLRAIGEAFGVAFPVYQVFTKCDKIPYFSDFFGRLPESEVSQVLGCTLPIGGGEPSQPGEVFAEAEAKRLTGAFRPLYHSLAERRLTHLVHEPNPARKPGIYEFPRELKRIRSPLVQFLTDVFRPYPLRPVPFLRGFYLTAVQEVEEAIRVPVQRGADWTDPNLGLETTRLFRGDATQIFNPDDPSQNAGMPGRKGVRRRWIFTSDLFHQVVLPDRVAQKAAPKDTRLEGYRRIAQAAVCGFCFLLCLAFATSWVQNRGLLNDVVIASSGDGTKPGNPATISDLRALEGMRAQVARLQNGESLSYHWFLYTGNAVMDAAKRAYFSRFQRLLLNDLNEKMLGQLRTLPETPSPIDPDEPAYDLLKTHLTISSGICKSDPAFVAGILKASGRQLSTDSEWNALADRQITFYAGALADGNPCRVREDSAACDRARQYLQGIKGLDRIYRNILAAAEKAVTKSQRLEDLAPDYRQVLSSKNVVSPVFSQQGWQFVQRASKKATSGGLGESCVIGNTQGPVGEWKQDVAIEGQIQQRFIREYIAQWQAFIAGSSVVPYRSASDAAQKLNILADHKSPLLALFALTANQTDFPITSESSKLEKLPLVGDVFKKSEAAAQAAGKLDLPTTAEIARTFQPVDWVVPPASEKWVVERNSGYIAALNQLAHSMQAIASGNADPAVYQAANEDERKALDAAKQITVGFKPVGVGGVDGEVERLLEEPIRHAECCVGQPDPGKKANGALSSFCVRLKNTLRKYPFQSKSPEDLSLDELAGTFSPAGGSIWKFCGESLSEFVVKDGPQWKSKDPAKKPQVTQEMLNFLNRAQAIADTFYPAGRIQPELRYALRPIPDPAFGNSYLELQLDGVSYQFKTALRKDLTWPPPPGTAKPRAIAGLRSSLVFASFADRSGLWGIFRIMGDAEPRALLSQIVEWKYSQVGDRAPIEPSPVKVEIVQFPGGADVFNPKFYEGLQCPTKAVQ